MFKLAKKSNECADSFQALYVSFILIQSVLCTAVEYRCVMDIKCPFLSNVVY